MYAFNSAMAMNFYTCPMSYIKIIFNQRNTKSRYIYRYAKILIARIEADLLESLCSRRKTNLLHLFNYTFYQLTILINS